MSYENKEAPTISVKNRLQNLERSYREKHDLTAWAIPPQIMNLMQAMSENGAEPVKIFHWLKGVKSFKIQSNGGIVLDCISKFYADKIFDFLETDLLAPFKTPKICTVVSGKTVRYLRSQEGERTMSPALQSKINAILGREVENVGSGR